MLVLGAAPSDFPLNDETVSPGFLGFGVVLAIGLLTYLLIRSMNKQMRRIQAPSEAVLKQQEWEAAQAAKSAKSAGTAPVAGSTARPTSSTDPVDGAGDR